MKELSFLIVIAATSGTLVQSLVPTTAYLPDGMHKLDSVQLFFDGFDGTPGSLPSRDNWRFDIGTKYPVANAPPGWGNNEVERYTASPDNIQITQQQKLSITPQRPRSSSGTWTSARIETQRSFMARAGGWLYIGARLSLGAAPPEKQRGIWAAFWALGEEFRSKYNWPAASEWDILESINGLPKMYSTVHCGYAPGGPCREFNGLGNGGVGFSRGEFHDVGFMVDRRMSAPGSGNGAMWLDETLTWYLDGKTIFNISGAEVADEEAWKQLAHIPHFLLLNVAVGGKWPGSPNSMTLDGPQVGMEVDYVEVRASL